MPDTGPRKKIAIFSVSAGAGHVHALWLYEHITGYFAATGIPIMPLFGEKRSRTA